MATNAFSVNIAGLEALHASLVKAESDLGEATAHLGQLEANISEGWSGAPGQSLSHAVRAAGKQAHTAHAELQTRLAHLQRAITLLRDAAGQATT